MLETSPSGTAKIARNIALAGMYLCLASLVISPVGMTIGEVVLFLGAIFSLPPKIQLKKFWQNKPAVFLSAMLLFQLISWFVTFYKEAWVEEMAIKTPLLLVLYSLSVIGPFTKKELKIGLGLLILGVFFTGTFSMVNYLTHKAEIDEMILRSKPMEISFSIPHIYFSIVMAFSVIVGYWIFRTSTVIFHKREKWFFALLSVANFGYMHVLTTRTGLVACYVTILALGLVQFIQHKQYIRALLLVSVISILPVIGYYTVSSFKNRVDNTWFDVSRYFQGKDPNYLSIGTRFESWKTAYSLFKEVPLTGTGTADIMQDMYLQYVEDESLLCPENQVEPHNQFIQYFVGYGIFGGIFFVFAWFYPIFNRRMRKPFLFQAFWLIYFLAMLGEATIERQIGVLFLALCWELTRQVKPDPEPEIS